MNKTFRKDLGPIKECLKDNELAKLLYIKMALQRADPFTKALSVAKWMEALKQMNIHVSRKQGTQGDKSP